MAAGALILVVEDNGKNMKLFRDVLLAKGYRTLEATSGEEAVALAVEHSPDLVLMDIQLPDIDGVAALGRLRADARTASLPVLALTAQAREAGNERRPCKDPRGRRRSRERAPARGGA
jgi:two-component system cell cycle response regulator DivK